MNNCLIITSKGTKNTWMDRLSWISDNYQLFDDVEPNPST